MAAAFYRWMRTYPGEALMLALMGAMSLGAAVLWYWKGDITPLSKGIFGILWVVFGALCAHVIIQGRMVWPILRWAAWGIVFRIPRFILFGGWGSYLAWAFICVWLFATTPDMNTRVTALFGGMFAAYRFYRGAERAVR